MSAERSGGAKLLLVVDVAVASADEGVDDARAGWGLLRGDSGGARRPDRGDGREASPAPGWRVAPGRSVGAWWRSRRRPSRRRLRGDLRRGDDRASWSVAVWSRVNVA
ncbi:MAG: hypothetical protein IPM45_17715 [Acidimicrobiales bacterium]|nr:hypothetical protein [Acidimicrobiales bacterium]